MILINYYSNLLVLISGWKQHMLLYFICSIHKNLQNELLNNQIYKAHFDTYFLKCFRSQFDKNLKCCRWQQCFTFSKWHSSTVYHLLLQTAFPCQPRLCQPLSCSQTLQSENGGPCYFLEDTACNGHLHPRNKTTEMKQQFEQLIHKKNVWLTRSAIDF